MAASARTWTFAAGLAGAHACIGVPAGLAQHIKINFEDIAPPACNDSLGFWLYERNVSAYARSMGSDMCIVKFTGQGGVPRMRPSSGQAYLRQLAYEPGEHAMIFVFTRGVTLFSFVRPRLEGTAAEPVVFPAWRMEAQDRFGNTLTRVSEDTTIASGVVPARAFMVSAPLIARIKITTLAQGDEHTLGMIMDDVVMELLPCGTADFNGDGDSGTDQDIEAFFACLAGNCCPGCYPGGADFNGDGDFGTDQDIEAFFRVLAGGAC